MRRGETKIGSRLIRVLGSLSRAREEHLHAPLLQSKIGRRFVRKKFVAVFDDMLVQTREIVELLLEGFAHREAVSAGKIARPFRAPFEGTDDAVGIARSHALFPRVHPALIKPFHASYRVQDETRKD